MDRHNWLFLNESIADLEAHAGPILVRQVRGRGGICEIGMHPKFIINCPVS